MMTPPLAEPRPRRHRPAAGCRLPTSQPALDDYDQALVNAAPDGVRLYPPPNDDNNGHPGTPELIYPLNEATGVSTTITLEWARADETDKYDVYLNVNDPPNDDPPESKLGTTTDTSWEVSGLQTGTEYKWQIIAKDGCAQSTGSAVRRFTTGS